MQAIAGFKIEIMYHIVFQNFRIVAYLWFNGSGDLEQGNPQVSKETTGK